MDSELRQLFRAYDADPGDIEAAGRLIAALRRIHVGPGERAIAFFIGCQTGCSCCRDENHHTGPYRSLHYARELVKEYTKTRRLASQYARSGHYSIGWCEVEIMPDGRIVYEDEDRIFDGFSDDPDFDGHNSDIYSDDFYPDSYNPDKLPDWYVDPDAKATT